MRVFQRTRAVRDGVRVGEIRHVDQLEKDRQRDKNARHAKIRNLCGGSAVRIRPVEYRVHQVGRDQRADRGSEGIERLRKVQAAGCGPLRAEDGYVGVGRNLQHGKTQAHDEECKKEKRIRNEHGCRVKQSETDSGDQQPDDHAVFVADFVDRITGINRDEIINQRTDGVSPEKRELHERALKSR